MNTQEFCDRHNACRSGREWALANCRDLPHAWETIRPDWLIWMATRPGVLDDRTLRRFAVWSARRVQHLMTDPRSIAALDVSERYAEGLATDKELAAAKAAAWAAAWAASEDLAGDAAWISWAAAWAAAWTAAEAAADAAEKVAVDAEKVAGAAAGAEVDAKDAARAAQAAWLRANATPNFA